MPGLRPLKPLMDALIAGVRQQEKEKRRLQQQRQKDQLQPVSPWWVQRHVIYSVPVFGNIRQPKQTDTPGSVFDELESLIYESDPYLPWRKYHDVCNQFEDLAEKYIYGDVDGAIGDAKNLMKTIRACVSEAKKALGEQ
jgi:hypothetical protein